MLKLTVIAARPLLTQLDIAVTISSQALLPMTLALNRTVCGVHGVFYIHTFSTSQPIMTLRLLWLINLYNVMYIAFNNSYLEVYILLVYLMMEILNRNQMLAELSHL